MDPTPRRQKSWFNSLTNFVAGGRSAIPDSPSMIATTNGGDRPRPTTRIDTETPAKRVSYAAPSISPPESPAKRASPSMLAQRKILDRPQGPSSRLGSANPQKTTNFSAATLPRNMFRNSIARDAAPFAFTPRRPPNTLKGSFPPETPGRSYRASTADLSGRGMAKTDSSDLFRMRIPEPDASLTGEELAKKVPQELSKTRSVYADEFLGHLCPPEFSEDQRRQFFCILDLRRLKYAANELFAKKDWKLNILNFAKEYEKSRSLIMLRYGLFEFKTVKVSRDVYDKWRKANNIPEPEEEILQTPAPKVNGADGSLRAGKRKAQDDLQPKTSVFDTSASMQSKRPRAAEREPLVETTTPALNQGKRKADILGNAGEDQQRKIQKSATKQSASRARTFFEQVANVSKEAPPAETPSIQVSKPAADTVAAPKPKPSVFASTPKAPNGSLHRSVLDGGLKAGSAQSGNIFGYLSDGSAKGSGNENADADGEDTDDSEREEGSDNHDASQSDEQSVAASGGVATPQPGVSLFSTKKPPPGIGGSSASSDASEAASGRSLADRITRSSNGQRLFALPQEPSTPHVESKAVPEKAPSPEKETAAPPANKTWNPDTPIKFATGPTQPKTTSDTATTPKPEASIFAPKESSTPAVGFNFGAGAAGKAPESSGQEAPEATAAPTPFGFLSKPSGSSTSNAASLFATASSTASMGSKLFTPSAAPPSSQLNQDAPKQAEQPSGVSGTNMFSAHAKDGSAPKSASSSVLQSQTLFGNAKKADEAKASEPQLSKPLFGASTQPKEPESTATLTQPGSSSIFANTAKASNLFGAASTPALGGSVEQAPAKPLSGAPSGQLASGFFSFGGSKPNGVSEADKPSASTEKKPLFGATPAPSQPAQATAKPLFGMNTTTQAEPPKTQGGIFANIPAAAAPAFSFGASQPTASALSFGASASQQNAPQSNGPISFGGGNSTSAGSSFSFKAGGSGDQSFKNPFANDVSSAQGGISFEFGGAPNAAAPQTGAAPFQFGADSATPTTAPPGGSGSIFGFGSSQQPAETTAPSSNIFGGASNGGTVGGSSGSLFNFGGSSQPGGSSMFSQQGPAPLGPSAPSIFNLAPPMGGTSTGTNTPFTFGGASSLATTPAAGTPEPSAAQDHADNKGQEADGAEGSQEQKQISLTEGGPGEEDEAAVYEVRAKALKLVTATEGSDSESNESQAQKSPWKTMGVGPLRLLKHKTTGAVRLLLRAEPRGHVALNKAILPNFNYKPEPGGKYVKLTTSTDSGSGLETWMLQVKTKEAAQALADNLEEHKSANKK